VAVVHPSRRSFLRLSAAVIAGLVGPGCSPSADYREEDAARLADQMEREAAAAGRGPYGKLVFRGYRGLAELPYFELDRDGELRVVDLDLPPAVDLHTHLGMSLLFAPDLDLGRRTPRTRYLLDCDRENPGCALDLDVYINSAFDEAMHTELSRELVKQLLLGSDAAATHTIPNLVAEMDRVGFGRATVLPIAIGLPFGDDSSERWLDAIERSPARDRLVPFASVHPHWSGWRDQLRSAAARGARGIKVHPEFQRLFPDETAMMEVYEECDRLGLVVLFHAGRSGIEPEFVRKYALLRRYEPAVTAFPQVQFVLGHAGARDVADAMRLASRHENVWLEITGQGVTQLDAILDENGSDRILFGSDWPFYPLAATLAKVLLVTERRPGMRAAILRGNADRLFAVAAPGDRGS
jgi:predicted TIM-barrel fold metal-dependent hydrolase